MSDDKITARTELDWYLRGMVASGIPETVRASILEFADKMVEESKNTINELVLVNDWGTPICAACKHGHDEGSWSDRDPNDGTCWSAGAFVCGCPKFITQSVAEIRRKESERKKGS